jgi:RNA polymerase sigma factor (TIGR02999 family)
MNRAEATRTLRDAAGGNVTADDQIWALVYDELRRIAHRELAPEGRGQTLSTTALVHEAYFKLVDQGQLARRDRDHFYALACRAMRQVLADHARRRNALKRHGKWSRVTLGDAMGPIHPNVEDLVALDEALTRLGGLNERLAKVVELRFYGGLSTAETADLLDVDVRTVERDWRRAKAYLYRMLEVEST